MKGFLYNLLVAVFPTPCLTTDQTITDRSYRKHTFLPVSVFAVRHYRNNGKDVNPDVNEMDKMDTEDRGIMYHLIIITLSIVNIEI